jgi:rare lipoprotein A
MNRWKAMGSFSWLGLILISSGCVTHSLQTPQHSTSPQRPPTAGNYQEVGLASWYGPGFYNHKTASGEKFKKKDLTCAHRTLPFGTRVLVKNLANDRTVEVRVNDRGPFVRSKIVDLSYAAAKEIGMFPGGSAKVELRTLVAEEDSEGGKNRLPRAGDSSLEIPAASASDPSNARDSESIIDLIKKAEAK